MKRQLGLLGSALLLLATTLVSGPSALAVTAPVLPVVHAGKIGTTTTTVVDTQHGRPASISCPSASFCMMVDHTGHAFTFDGSTWSAPTTYYPAATPGHDASDQLPSSRAVTCTSDTYCFVLGTNESDDFVWSSGTWTDLGQSGEDASGCAPGTTWCLVVESSFAWTIDGTTRTAVTGPGNASITALACIAKNDCWGVQGSGVSHYDGTSWTPSEVFPGEAGSQSAISCTAGGFCGAFDGQQESFLVNGTWATARSVAAQTPGQGSLSCTSDQSCTIAAGTDLRVDTPAASGTPGHATDVERLVSCSAAGSCVTADLEGRVAVETAGTWADPIMLDPGSGTIRSVSCGTLTSCTAVDDFGSVVTYNGTTWSAPNLVDRHAGFRDVSCAGTFCAAVGSWAGTSPGTRGVLATYDNGSWTVDGDVSGIYRAVSCASASFCTASDTAGTTMVWNGTEWDQKGTNLFNGLGIACPATDWCTNGAATFDGTAWTQSPDPFAPATESSITCLSTTWCLSVGSPAGYDVRVLEGGTWHDLGTGAGGGSPDGPEPVACATTYNCLIEGTVLADGAVVADWAVPTSTRPGAGKELTSVSASCAGPTLCVLADTQAVTVWHPGVVLPSVTRQPVGGLIRSGGSRTMSATFAGSPKPAITWQKSTDRMHWSAAGSGHPTITVAPHGSTYYRAIGTNVYGSSTTSVVEVRIEQAPRVTSQPRSVSVHHGSSTVLTATATGLPAPTVTWQRLAPGARTWTPVSRAHAPRLRVKVTRKSSGTRYRAVFVNAAGRVITHAAVVKAT